jgi:hypothetical protein
MANNRTAPPSLQISLRVSHEMLRLIAEIDEFKGRWEALQALAPERLRALRHVATIESICSSTRIEGVKLTDRQIETLLPTCNATPSNRATNRKSRATPKRRICFSRRGKN